MAEQGNVKADPIIKTSFHFHPQRNWLNDPNAPMYYKGFYHLFYQHNPLAPEFGKIIIWGHSVSKDMVNWIQLEPAITNTEPYDILSCWSGAATILPDGRPVILYTGLEPFDGNNKRQVTIVAEPKDASDPLLREWVKPKYNPVMRPPENVRFYCFRDPTTAWQGPDGIWRVLIGAQENDCETGMAILYRSDDFVTWTQFPQYLVESPITGMWECPDFFPVSLTGKEGVETSVNNDSVRHAFKASFGGKEYYVLGKYTSETEEFAADYEFTRASADLKYDEGTFFASKAFFDSAKNRRINWGWVIDTDSKEDDYRRGWSSVMSLPRQIWMDTCGKRLIQWPIEEINHLRTNHVSYDNLQLQSGSTFEIEGITASQADVEVTFNLPILEDNPEIMNADQVSDDILFNRDRLDGCVYGPFGLLALASSDLSEQTAIFFKVIRRGNGYAVVMCSCEKKSTLRENDITKATFGTFLNIDPRHEKISLRCLIDHSVIESYGAGGKSVITSRAYPKFAVGEAAKLFLFNGGTKGVIGSSLEAWSMRDAQINENDILSIIRMQNNNLQAV